MFRHRPSRCVLALLAAPFAATAAATEFGVPAGDFNSGASWVGGNVPGVNESANINNGGTATFSAGTRTISELHLGLAAGQTGAMTMTGGTLNVGPGADDNTIAIGDFGTGTLNMSGGVINLPDNDFHIGRNGTGSVMTMTGGQVFMNDTLRIARGQNFATATGTLNLNGGEFNTGTGVVVARGNNGSTPTGTFVIGGTGKFIAGNDLGEGNPSGTVDEGFFSLANNPGATANVTVQGNGLVKALRLTGRQGNGNLTIEGEGRFLVVPPEALGAGVTTGLGAYSTYLGGGSATIGDGGDGATGNYSLTLRGNGTLDVDANAFGRDEGRAELQGLVLARGNASATATIANTADLVVRQRFVIGGMGARANLNGFDGAPESGENPGGTAIVTMTGGTVTADHLIVGGSGAGTFNVSGGAVRTQAFNDTFDPTANGGSGAADTSVNSIRIGMLQGSVGSMNVSGTATVTTGGDLDVGHYGDGALRVTGGAATVQARNVFVQKLPGSTGKVVAAIGGNPLPSHTAIKASESVTINGGTLEVQDTGVIQRGAWLFDILVADSDGNASGSLTGTFATHTLPPDDAIRRRWSVLYENNKVRAGLTLPGDASFNGFVNSDDFIALAQNFGRSGKNWREGDFDRNGTVNSDDFILLAQNFGRTVNFPAAAGEGVTASDWATLAAFGEQIGVAVPEPAGLGSLAVTGLLLRRRRREASVNHEDI